MESPWLSSVLEKRRTTRVKAPVDVQRGADEAAQRKAGDEQHRKPAFGEVFHHRLGAQKNGGKAHGSVKRLLVFFREAPPQGAAKKTARHNGGGVHNGAQHPRRPFLHRTHRQYYKRGGRRLQGRA